MEERPSFCSTMSWTSYGFQIRTLKTALRPLGKKKQWRCCYTEMVPFFTRRGKLILNKGAMTSISRLKGLSVCVNVVSKNTKLTWQNLNGAETEKKIRQRQVSDKGSAVVRALASHRCGPGSNPGVNAICGLSLLLVLSLAPRAFSPGSPVFPSPQKLTLPNSNSIWNARTRLNEFIWTLKCFVGKKVIYFFCYQ